MKKIKLKVVTLERVVYSSEVDRLTIPTETGVIGVLPDHVPLISLLAPGELVVHKDGEKIHLAMTTGFIEVRKNSEVIILADTADRVEEMNVEEIRKAKERVEKILKDEQNLSDVEFAHFEDVLGREISRLNIAERHKR